MFDWKIHKKGKKSYYQILRADGKSQMYMIFSHMLKSFDREDLEDMYKLVKAKYESTRPVEDLDLVLWNDLKNVFEPHVKILYGGINKDTKCWNEPLVKKLVHARVRLVLLTDKYEIFWMRIEQYIQMIDYALWEVIENGANLTKTQVVEGVTTVMPITSAEDKAQRRLEVNARSTLMMGIPNEKTS
ncbi:hypothetical protein Tco_0250605 [Tanacetum coccineum]